MKLEASYRLKASTYKYAMVNRPVGIGACPKEGLVGTEPRPPVGSVHHAMARNGIAVYDRPLSHAETKQFEMAPIVDGDAITPYVETVIKGFGDYASAYAEIATEDFDEFQSHVMDKLKSKCEGYVPSLDPKLLAEKVLAAIGE